MQYIIGILFIAIFLVVCFCTSSWFSIARIHATIWLILYWGYCLCSREIKLEGFGSLWLIASCFFILLGEKLGEREEQQEFDRTYLLQSHIADSRNKDKFWIIIIGSLTAVSIVGNIAEVYAYGFNLRDLLTFRRILSMSHEIATLRYQGIEVSALITLLQTQKYIGCLVGGYYFFRNKKVSNKIICCLPFLPVILNVLIENTKAGVIASAILFCIGLIIGYAAINRRCPRMTVKWALKIVGAIVVLMLLLVFAMMIRLGAINSKTLGIVSEKFIIYAFGSVQAFDFWLSKVYRFDGVNLGVNTFMAPFNVLGIVSRKQGVYGFIDGATSNVFTGYRGVIEDFGIIGGLFFVMLLGYIGGISIKRITKMPTEIASKTCYLFVFFFVVYSLIISPYVYSSFCIMIIEFPILLYIEKNIVK